ncbi:MAG: hypothetical protein IJX43_01320 [Alphaproteobacteria bacterium]|nr:hypothetical protein [Alphaproteobacteria bacterium]
MPNKTNSKLSTWLFWSPLKFAFMSLGIMLTAAFIFSIVASTFYTNTTLPQTPMLIILVLGICLGAIIQIRKLPTDKMDRQSFIALHNGQTIILSLAFMIASYLIFVNYQQIMFSMLIMETNSSVSFLMILIIAALFYLYLTGLAIANIYAKFRRIREFDVPTWKIIFSMPFGFSGLWTAGYLLNTPTQKQTTIQINSKWYSAWTKWVISRPATTIATFIVITILSGFFFGFNAVLLTFSLALIFGIWTLQIGSRQFTKTVPTKYATTTVIINITLLVIFLGFRALVPPTTQNVQINITDTEIITTDTGE